MLKEKIKEVKIKEFRETAKEMRSKEYDLVSIVPLTDNGLDLLYFFNGLENNVKIFKVKLNAGHAHMDSVVDIYPVANAYELETRDLHNVWFDGNDNMKKRFFLSDEEFAQLEKQHNERHGVKKDA